MKCAHFDSLKVSWSAVIKVFEKSDFRKKHVHNVHRDVSTDFRPDRTEIIFF